MRNTTDWENLNSDEIQYPKLIWKNEKYDIDYGKMIWKKLTNDSDYCEVRNEIKKIAMSNWCNIYNLSMIVDCTNIEINQFVKALGVMFENYIILPTDDDDWYSPNISNVLSIYGDKKFLRWKGMRYSQTLSGEIDDMTDGMHILSNSYAITKSGIELLSPEDQEMMIKNHTMFYTLCEKYNQHHFLIEEKMSIYNLHPASISYLVNCKSHPIELRNMPFIPTGLEWAMNDLHKMIEVNNKLWINRSIKML